MNRLLRRVLCGILGRHKAPDVVWRDEVNTGGYCARCGVPVLGDSQGNWFENDWRQEPRDGR